MAAVAVAWAAAWLSLRGAGAANSTLLRAHGRHSTEELDARAKAMTSLPDSTVPVKTLFEYFVSMHRYHQAAPTLPADAFTAFAAADLKSQLPEDYLDNQLPGHFKGVWCMLEHPSDLACFMPYNSELEFDESGKGLPAQGFQPRKMIFWDNQAGRGHLEFFTRFNLEFQLPLLDTNATGSGLWTSMRDPLDMLPYAAALYEGFPEGYYNLVRMRLITGDLTWDPDTSEDPALCFCSVVLDGPNLALRNNFGKLAYKMYRVIDDQGAFTPYWDNFTALAAEKGDLVLMSETLEPDFDCSDACFRDVVWQMVTLGYLTAGLISTTLAWCVICGVGAALWIYCRKAKASQYDPLPGT